MNLLTTTALNVFSANTKAKSAEINANFSTVKDYLTSFSYDAKHGAIALQTSSKSADYTVLDTDGISTIHMTTGASNTTVTLPTVSDNNGRIICVKKMDSGAGYCVVDGEGSETIDELASYRLYKINDAITIQSNGTKWVIITAPAFAPSCWSHSRTAVANIQNSPGSGEWTNDFTDANYISGSISVANGGANTINGTATITFARAGWYRVVCKQQQTSLSGADNARTAGLVCNWGGTATRYGKTNDASSIVCEIYPGDVWALHSEILIYATATQTITINPWATAASTGYNHYADIMITPLRG